MREMSEDLKQRKGLKVSHRRGFTVWPLTVNTKIKNSIVFMHMVEQASI